MEIPYTFRHRQSAESQLDSMGAQEFIILFLEKLFGVFVPIRFLLFAFVGALWLIVHLAVLGIMVDVLDQGFREGQTMAVLTAMTFNFVLNNRLTYRDMRLKGAAFIKGLFTFYAVCLVGAIGNISVGEMIYVLDNRCWLGDRKSVV